MRRFSKSRKLSEEVKEVVEVPRLKRLSRRNLLTENSDNLNQIFSVRVDAQGESHLLVGSLIR